MKAENLKYMLLNGIKSMDFIRINYAIREANQLVELSESSSERVPHVIEGIENVIKKVSNGDYNSDDGIAIIEGLIYSIKKTQQ